MTVTVADVDRWRAAPSEHQRLEFKEAKAQYDFRKLADYCVAIANEGGGHLLLGVADHPPRAVVGTQAFRNIVDAASQLFQRVGFRVEIDEVAHTAGRVLVFSIPSRPRATAYHVDGRYLMRAGESLVGMSEDQLRRIFAEGAPDRLEEPIRAGIDAQDVVELLDTQAFFELLKLPYPTDRNGVIDRLLQERIIDRDESLFSIRRIGALLLAKRLDLFDGLAAKSPRLVVYFGASKLQTRLDVTHGVGYAVGFRALVALVMGQLPQNEVISEAIRREVTIVPEMAMRELIANALIHQDFGIAGASVMMEVYADRIEISNPGEPIVPVERFIDGYESRNERLAGLMRRFGICEEKSSGIDRVVDIAEGYQLPAPVFRSAHRRTVVIVFGHQPFELMDRDDRVRACYQHCVLRWVMSRRMTNQSLRERFGQPESRSSSVSQIIASTIDAGLIKSDAAVGGSRKFARYLPFWA